ncbi:hypothetical protein V6N13_068910 [Hibiscus sabdariffa]|uniref:Syntaxin 6/10/61 N-terminal domain-containing protein n=1 Tax=Hibiscus sabdariffa TaxID=183260 RepID=A0ABR2QP10_9ROSI
MAVNSFDLWQKDAFFSAAEEVQESADIMESAYRMWIKEKRKGLKAEDSAELCRELQTALGTAKWQLEEFERAIRSSHGHRTDDVTATRHKQFIAAIESQISRVEAAFKEAFSEEGKQPLRWVNLDEEECDDLAIFLSGTSPTLPAPAKNTLSENCHKTDSDFNATCNGDTYEVKIAKDSSNGAECVIDVEDGETSGRADDGRITGSRKTWSSPNFGALRIVIADEYDNRSQIRSGIESTPKEKGSKHFLRKQRCGDLPQAGGAFNLFCQRSGSVGGYFSYRAFCALCELRASGWLLCAVDQDKKVLDFPRLRALFRGGEDFEV